MGLNFNIFIVVGSKSSIQRGDVTPRKAELFEEVKGSVLEGYLLLRESGANIPPAWIARASESRHNLHKEVVLILQKGELDGLSKLRQWEKRYNKECFYRGIRALLELERKGETKY